MASKRFEKQKQKTKETETETETHVKNITSKSHWKNKLSIKCKTVANFSFLFSTIEREQANCSEQADE